MLTRPLLRLLIALAALLAAAGAVAGGPPAFRSAHALVLDDATGEVLLEKDAHTAAPIASITKLITAMVVLDANLDPEQPITVANEDMDWLKHTRAGVPAGATLPRSELLELALIASDNHAAAALARTYPGGDAGFVAAVEAKIAALGLSDTHIEEPTGLSPANRSSAADLASVLRAAAGYAAITQITSSPRASAIVNGRRHAVKNTNALVGKPGWDILLSKTGYTQEAGRCLVMRLRSGERTLLIVLMGALRAAQRTADAVNAVRWLTGQPLLATDGAGAARKPRRARLAARTADQPA